MIASRLAVIPSRLAAIARLAASLLLLAALVNSAAAQEFRAAVVKLDITPKTPKWLMGYAARQSTGVHDPIFHRIVVMDDGKTRFALVSTEVCVFSPALYDQAAARVEKETGIAPVNFWWTVTHTHSAPEIGPLGLYDVLLKGRSDHPVDSAYTNEVVDMLVTGIWQASEKLEPARLATGAGLSLANINRRARDPNGVISLGLNPDGPVDRQIGLIRIDKASGAPLALIANYAMHGTVLGGKWMEISGDAQGAVADYVEKKTGAPMLYVNGAAGNIAPIYSVYDTPRAGHLAEFNVLLGDRILSALAAMGPATPRITLRTSETIVETPRKDGLDWTKELARYGRVDAAGAPLVRLPLRFLEINDTLIWGGPVEMFCEIAIAVREKSPFSHTFFFGYTNGWLGYLPTKAGFAEGGYEPRTSPFSDRVERDVTSAAILKAQSGR